MRSTFNRISLRFTSIIFLCLISVFSSRSQSKDYQKVFVLGNSLTLGFGTHGMAATSVNTDYYYWVKQHLLARNESLRISRFKGVKWEAGNSEARSNFIHNTLIDLVDGDEDLIIIQLGDNVNNDEKRATFVNDAIELVQWFSDTSPDARIVWVFGWYWVTINQPLLIEAFDQSGNFEIIDITGINYADGGIYQSAIGNTYINSEGVVDTIQTAGTASHPGDLGMFEIATRIIDHLDNFSPLSEKIPYALEQEDIFSLTGKRLGEIPRNQIFIVYQKYSDGTVVKFKGLIKE